MTAVATLVDRWTNVRARLLETIDKFALSELDFRTPCGADYRLGSMVNHLIEHEIHHRAELSLVLGMLGKQGLNA